MSPSREGSPANRNMCMESFHRAHKEIYREGKQNKHVDHLLSTFCKISRDKAYKQLIKAERGKVAQRQHDNNKQHEQAEFIPTELVLREDDGSWRVCSITDTNRFYYRIYQCISRSRV